MLGAVRRSYVQLDAVRRAFFARRVNQKILIHAPKDQRHRNVNRRKCPQKVRISFFFRISIVLTKREILYIQYLREFLNIFTKHKNVDKKNLKPQKEELLCEKLREFPVLFDKSHKG